MRPQFSVVIPVRNGAALVAATLDSLRAQTHPDWEAVVVDDGSTDATGEVVAAVAELDDRVRLVRQEPAGVSAARNRGLAEARFDWVLFLDGDDLLTPRFLERVAYALEVHPRADAANTGWARLLPDGRLFDEVNAEVFEDLFAATARYCPFAIHTCIVRRDLVLAVGGFDETLRVCEDWDLWGRLARLGMRIVPVWDAVAVYRVRADSATFDGVRTMRDGVRALDRIHGPDPRVQHPLPRYARGFERAHLPEALIELAVWSAGLMIGQEADALEVLDQIPDPRAPAVDPARIAASLHISERVGALGEPLWSRWSRAAKRFRPFLARLEQLTGASGLATRVERRLAQLAADECRSAAPVGLGSLLAVPLRLDRPVADVAVPDGIERIRFRVEYRGILAGHAEVAVGGPVLGADEIVESVLRQVAEGVLDVALRGAVSGLRHPSAATLLGAALWGLDPHPLHRQPSVPAAPERRVGRHTEVELALPHGDLVADGDRVEVRLRLAGVPLIDLVLRPRNGRVTAAQLRATALRAAPVELARATVGVGLLGQPPDSLDELRRRLAAAAAEARQPFGRPRRIRARLAGERSTAMRAVAPDVEHRLRAAAQRLPPASRQRAKRWHSRLVAWSGPLAPFVPEAGSRGVPVLMYHRVAPSGSAAARRWRVTPEELDDQLRALQRAGYTGVSLERLRRAWYEGEKLPRRPVVLTFDDGFADFAEHAWPRVRDRGFDATVFVVTDAVGDRNAWDDVYDDRVELMDWATLRRLHAEGVDLGSHSVDHAALTSLPPQEVRREVEQSRAQIEQETGAEVRSFAYPFGDVDTAVAQIVADTGYDFAVTCEPGPVTARAEPLLLPRVEVTPTLTGRALVGELSRLRG